MSYVATIEARHQRYYDSEQTKYLYLELIGMVPKSMELLGLQQKTLGLNQELLME